MIIDYPFVLSRTPFRISLFGGGSDHRDWFASHGGEFISASISKYVYLTCRRLPPVFEYDFRLSYSRLELVSDLNDVAHPAVRQVLKDMNIRSFELGHQADLPACSGLGSSSSFAVGLYHCVLSMLGQPWDKYRLAKLAIELERCKLAEAGGIQDQIAASYGGLNHVRIHTDGSFKVSSIDMSSDAMEALEERLILVFSGYSRISSEVLKKQMRVDNYSERKEQNIKETLKMLPAGKRALVTCDFEELGRLFSESWSLKRSIDHESTNARVDDVYNFVMKSGALGGRLLGAGGGGFFLFVVDPHVRKVLHSHPSLSCVDIRFDHQGSMLMGSAGQWV